MPLGDGLDQRAIGPVGVLDVLGRFNGKPSGSSCFAKASQDFVAVQDRLRDVGCEAGYPLCACCLLPRTGFITSQKILTYSTAAPGCGILGFRKVLSRRRLSYTVRKPVEGSANDDSAMRRVKALRLKIPGKRLMNITTRHRCLMIESETYQLVIDQEVLLARLYLSDAPLYYFMSLLSAVDTVEQSDETENVVVEAVEHEDHVLVVIRHHSTLWEEKTSVYACYEDHLTYHVEVQGAGDIDRAYFFRGHGGGNELASIPGFDYFMSGCPNFLEKKYFHSSEYCSINAGHESFAWGNALASGPLCFVFTNDFESPWLSVGVACTEAEWGFQSFEFNHKSETVRKTHDSIVGTQAFSLSYYGHHRVEGTWKTPRLIFQVGDDAYSAMGRYVESLYDTGLVARRRSEERAWWHRPIFCGWHEQLASHYAKQDANLSRQCVESSQGAFAACTQENYRAWLDRLEANDCKPDTIIIDALWQKSPDTNVVDETKWPDLRGFIDRCHADGQRVCLWIDCWRRGIADEEECVRMDGRAVCCDPTNPRYVARLRDELRTMLSDARGCYHADGLKVDGLSTQPYGYGMKTCGGIYGFALQKTLLSLIYRQAKALRSDALVSLFTANPFYADVCDMARIGDMYTTRGDSLNAMRDRARLIRIGIPGVPIDTDGQFMHHMMPGIEGVVERQAETGIPTLYCASKRVQQRVFSIPQVRDLSKAEYGEISEAFRKF